MPLFRQVTHNHDYFTEDYDDVTDGEGSADLGHLYLTVLEGETSAYCR